MKWRLAGSALLVVAALSSVGAQQDFQPDPLSRLDIQSRRQIQNLIDSARLADLPWTVLRLKAIEGANRKIEGRKVVSVVRDLYKSLVVSKAALGPLASAEDIETGASVLAARVSPEDLAKFRVSTAGRSPMRALVYLADLIDKHNVPRDDAIDAFTRLWKDGAADSDFDGLWRLVDQDILSGVNPRSALQSRMRSLPPRVSKPPGDQSTENSHS
jgi:hypothetical protein